MEIIFKEVVYNDYNLTFTINNNDITGITGRGKSTVLDLINLSCIPKGQVTYNNEKLTKTNINQVRRKISLVKKDFEKDFGLDTVRSNMEYIIRYYKLIIKDPEKKMQDSLKIVGLNKSYLERKVNSLAKSELKLVQIAISLLSNPEVILLDEPFEFLDTKNEKKLYMLLTKLKEQYQKSIIIASNNSNKLYKYTKKMIFIKNNQVLLEGDTNEVYTRVDYLKRNKFTLPDLIMFTYKVKKNKKVNIDYHKDIRDIIKDIYKHV